QPGAAVEVGVAGGFVVAIGDQIGGGAGGEVAVARGGGGEDDLDPVTSIGPHAADGRLLLCAQRAVVEDRAAVRFPHLVANPVRAAAAAAFIAQAQVPAAIPQPQPADAAVAGPFVVVEDH